MNIKQKSLLFFLNLILSHCLQGQISGGGEANPDLTTHKDAIQEFQDLRFGMFIHWGPVTLRGTEIGWSRGREISAMDYDNLYKEFNPVLFNPKEWVRTAKEAGMKYIVFTTKHHDGFSLWDTKQSEYKITNSPYGKDVVKQLAAECKRQGILFGAYYSIADWHYPDNPMIHPIDNSNSGSKDISDPSTKAKMDSYIVYMKNQLKELINNYDPSIIWFDGEWEWVWTHEMGMDLYKYVRSLKDDIIINNRVDKGRKGMEDVTIDKKFAGDFATPEQQVGKFDNINAWETCMTIAQQWAWKPNDILKSKKECIETLLQTVGGDGNLLFNIGPMLDGRIEQRQKDRLKDIGDWLKSNGEAIYGTRGGPYKPLRNMVSTHKENKIYLHLFEDYKGPLHLPFPKTVKINKAFVLKDNLPLQIARDGSSLTIELPEAIPSFEPIVVVLELKRTVPEMDVFTKLKN